MLWEIHINLFSFQLFRFTAETAVNQWAGNFPERVFGASCSQLPMPGSVHLVKRGKHS